MRVFISYSNRDEAFARQLSADLLVNGAGVSDDKMLGSGDSWAKALQENIEQADFFIVVLSPDSVVSRWVIEEIELALRQEAGAKRIKVVPIMFRSCSPPAMLAAKEPIDFRSSYQEGLRKLLSALGQSSKVNSAVKLSDEWVKNIVEGEGPPRRTPSAQSEGAQAATDSSRFEKTSKKCFMVMPFGREDLNVVYEDFITPVVTETCRLGLQRGDDIFGSSPIMDDILTSIERANLVIADLTGKNANVFYEIGICHAFKKPVLLLAQSTDDVPFDLRHRRVLMYEYSPRGCKRLETALKDHLTAMLADV